MIDISRRHFLGLKAAGFMTIVMGSKESFSQDREMQGKSTKMGTNKYSVVRITVKEIRTHCPFYKEGDVFLIRQQCFDPTTATAKQFCIHSLNDIYENYMKVRRGPVGGKTIVGCMDNGIVQLEIEHLQDEEGPGWN